MARIPNEQLLNMAMELISNGEDAKGICASCGHVQDGVEPDASGYQCEYCGELAVSGAEQLVLVLAWLCER